MNKVDTTGKYGGMGAIIYLLFSLQSQVGTLRSDMNLVLARLSVDQSARTAEEIGQSLDTGKELLSNAPVGIIKQPGVNHGTSKQKQNKNVCDDRQSDTIEAKSKRSTVGYICIRRNE